MNIVDILRNTNGLYNNLPYIPDGIKDYWQTPEETNIRQGGDCEDKAIAKFFALIEAGIDPDDLCIVLTRIERVLGTSEDHMIMLYKADDDLRILDNVVTVIHPVAWREDLKPICAFNLNRRWLVRSKRIHNEMHWEFQETHFFIKKWDELLERKKARNT